MDERIAIWNILRGGKISAVSEEGDILTVLVSIPYIRRRLNPLGDSFILTLTGVRRAEYRGFCGSGPACAIREGVESEIVQTTSRVMPITIETMSDTTLGQIVLDFQSIRFALDARQVSDYQTIQKVYEEYWEENWKNETFRG